MAAEVERAMNEVPGGLRPPGPGDRVFKDECMYSFDTPETDTGLFVCLRTFWGLGRDFVESYSNRSGSRLFLHIRRIKHKKPKPETQTEGPEKKITKLAIGVEGGFDVGMDTAEYDIEEQLSIVVLPGMITIPLPDASLPAALMEVVAGVMAAESALKAAELESMAGTWDGERRFVSKHSENLLQLQNGKKVGPKGWRCEAEGCDKTENLWMNLTDGMILCGRKNFDGTGGNNHAVEHYAKTKYPLAVKLGTITADGKADVYSYDEDDMVEDPRLVAHLAHFGINAKQLELTEKTMLEMEIELNMKHLSEISALTETGKTLKPMRGPGLTGMANMGNSCYLNSLMQILFTIPEFQDRFSFSANKYFQAAYDPLNDFNLQMSKLCLGLLSGKYSAPMDHEDVNSDAQLGIRPLAFKSVVGKGHPEFSTKKQQDAQEFFLHIINVLERNGLGEKNPADVFKFEVEDKVVCDATGYVRYSSRAEYCLPLPIPMEAAINKQEVIEYEKRKAAAAEQRTTLAAEETVRHKIPLDACIEAFVAKETLDPFYSSATKKVGTASKFTRLGTFPDYLVIQLKKFCMGDDWTPKKLDVSVDMPVDLDLSMLRGKGKQEGEHELPDEQLITAPAKPAIDESVVAQLLEMGFHPNACRRAVVSSGNSGADNAMGWLMERMDDPSINDPLPEESCSGAAAAEPSEEALSSIQAMGFTLPQARKALRNTDNNVQRAIDWIFSHPDELNEDDQTVVNANNLSQKSTKPTLKDGPAKYKLVGFISHMGPSSMVGHYVAHIWKDNSWVLFNDNRVAASEILPKDLGYLYVYRRA